MKKFVLICEDGWEGTRKFALSLASQGTPVSVVVKGDPGYEVRQMISPKPGIRNYFLQRPLYWAALLPLLFWLFLKGQWNTCCITKRRTYQSLRKLQTLFRCFDLYLFLERGDQSQVVLPTGVAIPMYAFLETL